MGLLEILIEGPDIRSPGRKVPDIKFPLINTDARSPHFLYMRLEHKIPGTRSPV